MKFSEQLSQKTPAKAASPINCHWKIFRPKYIFQKISHSIFLIYVLIFNGMCSQGKSSRSQMFYKIGVLKNFAIFSEKHHRKTPLLKSLFFIKLQVCFPVNFAKFLRTLYPQNTFGGGFCQ